MTRIVTKSFTSSGSWTAPAGVTSVIVIGMGGGGGGGGGGRGQGTTTLGQNGGAGGCATSMQPALLTVVPNTTYTIIIGAGGGGGAGTTMNSNTVGSNGGDTTFGALYTWYGAINKGVISAFSSDVGRTGIVDVSNRRLGSAIQLGLMGGSGGGKWPSMSSSRPTGQIGIYGNGGIRGTAGGNVSVGDCGAGGGAGASSSIGFGANGGNGGGGNPNSASAGSNGASASANTGAGGGGGGGAGTAPFDSTIRNGGSGGTGGSGYMVIIWAE